MAILVYTFLFWTLVLIADSMPRSGSSCGRTYYYVGFSSFLFVDAFVPQRITRSFRVQQRHPQITIMRPSLKTNNKNIHNIVRRREATSSMDDVAKSKVTLAQPRTGPLQWLLDVALASPLWKLVMVPQARKTMISTANDNGIDWQQHLNWISSQDGPWTGHRHHLSSDSQDEQNDNVIQAIDENFTIDKVPSYYKKPFHAYEEGNLSWQAALEVEIASRAVGARNFPAFGSKGEDAFRDSFEIALSKIGASVPCEGTVVDVGCGTGMSTRRLARAWPDAKEILGYDLSPYYVQVGKRLLELAPSSSESGGPWVTTVENDKRIDLRVGNAAETGLPNDSVDVVNIMFVLHELPLEATIEVLKEAKRILKPNEGQLWICEMDFSSPAYAAQRANPLLFSLIRATEPYLDEYADYFESDVLSSFLYNNFENIKITAATGRHYSLVAKQKSEEERSNNKSETSKDGTILEDLRFNADGTYRMEDTHLMLWETKNE